MCWVLRSPLSFQNYLYWPKAIFAPLCGWLLNTEQLKKTTFCQYFLNLFSTQLLLLVKI